MAGRVDLNKRVADMMKLISPEADNPGKHFRAANELIVDMADLGMETMEMMERLYFLTEGWREKDARSAGERLRSILKASK